MDVKKQATIVDVAKKAGVSVATVSRVVNGNYPVKQFMEELKDMTYKIVNKTRA